MTAARQLELEGEAFDEGAGTRRTPADEVWRSAAAAFCAAASLRLGEIEDTPAAVKRAYSVCRSLGREELLRLRDDYDRRLLARGRRSAVGIALVGDVMGGRRAAR